MKIKLSQSEIIWIVVQHLIDYKHLKVNPKSASVDLNTHDGDIVIEFDYEG